MNAQDNAVAILGAVPPPFGGVTTHLDRLLYRLADAGVPHRLYDLEGHDVPARGIVPGDRGASWFLRFLLTVSQCAVHTHTNNVRGIILAAHVLRRRRRQLIVTLHSEAPMRWYRAASRPWQWLWRRSLREAWIISTNSNLDAWAEQLGVPGQRRVVAPAFIAPSAAEKARTDFPPEIREFLGSHHPVVGTHGWWGFYINGVHVYSFDMIVKLIQAVRKTYPDAGFYTLISGKYDETSRGQTLEIRSRLGLERHWVIAEGLPMSVALYARSTAFVRPTITDGDSVSVRECLHLGVPVVASDAVPRPEGCLLFPNRDQEAMERRVMEALADPEGCRRRLAGLTLPDSALPVIQLYRRVLERV